jgi:hypothetical protein
VAGNSSQPSSVAVIRKPYPSELRCRRARQQVYPYHQRLLVLGALYGCGASAEPPQYCLSDAVTWFTRSACSVHDHRWWVFRRSAYGSASALILSLVAPATVTCGFRITAIVVQHTFQQLHVRPMQSKPSFPWPTPQASRKALAGTLLKREAPEVSRFLPALISGVSAVYATR